MDFTQDKGAVKMKKLLLPVVALCCLTPTFAFATHPLLTESAETVAPKAVEAETAIEYGKKSGDKQFILQETVNAGVIPHVDVFIALPFISGDVDGSTNSGLSDISIGAKWNFGHVDAFALAVKPALLLPLGDDKKNLGEGGVGFGATLIASTELANKISIDGNIGLKHQETGDGSYNRFDLSVDGKFDETEHLKAVGEFALSNTDESGSTFQAYLAAGAIYALQKNLDVDLGLRLGLTSKSEDFRLLAGATYKF